MRALLSAQQGVFLFYRPARPAAHASYRFSGVEAKTTAAGRTVKIKAGIAVLCVVDDALQT
jgi:hypothetical protein